MRFRLDKWWFGVLLILRGPLMSLVVTCATNFPAAQVCLNSLILTIYIVIQAMARPWKAALLNWVDVCISVLLIQIIVLSGIGVRSEAFSDVFGGIVLGLFFSIIGFMLLAVGFAALQELCANKDAKDSMILSIFESRSTGLGQRLRAVANGVVQHEETFLQAVLENLNNHDLSNIQNSIDLISFELMLGGGFKGKMRIQSESIAAPSSAASTAVADESQDMVMAPPQVAAVDPADPDQAITRDGQQTLTPEVAANPSSVAPVEPDVAAGKDPRIVSTAV